MLVVLQTRVNDYPPPSQHRARGRSSSRGSVNRRERLLDVAWGFEETRRVLGLWGALPGASPSPVEVNDFVSFQSKHDGSTVKGRVVEVAWLGGDHWSAMVKMAGRPGNAIVRADELTKLSQNKRARSHATIATGQIGTVNEFWDLYEAELVKSILEAPEKYALRSGESAGDYGRRIRESFQQTAESSGLGQINLDSNTFKRVARRLGIAKFSQKALKTAYLGLAR